VNFYTFQEEEEEEEDKELWPSPPKKIRQNV
jgi:hypothetical protein